jgi:hypothetical protein
MANRPNSVPTPRTNASKLAQGRIIRDRGLAGSNKTAGPTEPLPVRQKFAILILKETFCE